MAKISVIVPTYNVGKYILKLNTCLTSQTQEDIEIIYVDDGSSDDTFSLLQSIDDERVKVFSVNHSGPSKARNVGLDNATGEYIRFVDADDYIADDSCELLLNPIMENCSIDLVVGNFTFDDPENIFYDGSELISGVVSSREYAAGFLSHFYTYFYGFIVNKLYKRDIIESNNLRLNENLGIHEDFDFNIRYLNFCRNIYYQITSEGIYHYIAREDSITHSEKHISMEVLSERREQMIETARTFFSKNGLEHEMVKAARCEYLVYELNDLVDTYGFSIKKCLQAYKIHCSDAIVQEYLDEHPEINKGFVFYYLRGVSRSIKRVLVSD